MASLDTTQAVWAENRILLRGSMLAIMFPHLLLLLAADKYAEAQVHQQRDLQFFNQHVRTACNYNVVNENSTFLRNLDTVVDILRGKAAAGETYYMANVTDGSPDKSSWVFAGYQCRGDLDPMNCSSCIVQITASGCSNGNVLGMRVTLVGCYYRYENYDFTTSAGFNLTDIYDYNCVTDIQGDVSSRSLYEADLFEALNQTSFVAPTRGGYASMEIGSAYALSQCLGYLSPSDCATCLHQSPSPIHNSTCLNSSYGFYYYASCYILFSDTNFLFSDSSLSLAANPSPSPDAALLPSPSYTSISPSYDRLPARIVVGSSSSSLSTGAIAGMAIALAFVLFAVVAFAVVCIANRRRSAEARQHMRESISSHKFAIKELESATEKFRSRNKLGQGGFGVVYKGTLRSGKEVAIKVISPDRQNQVDFMNEVKLISTVVHQNLIQLLGYAMDNRHWYLVHEYLPNRSLDLHLFGSNDRHELEACPLDWKTRFNIIVGIARGLYYLHEESHVRIVHRDIKASNILLDGNLKPIIADFGLARLFPTDASHLTTALAGTLGYVAPEYVMGGQLSEKVDVYSFGLLTLEILSGRRVIQTNVVDTEERHILQWAWELYERKQEMNMVDKRILETANEGEVVRVVHMALLCTQTKPQTRPTMSHICAMLHNQSLRANIPSRPTSIVSMGMFSGSSSNSHTSNPSHHSNLSNSPITELHPR